MYRNYSIALMAVITGLSIASCATSQSPTPSAPANTPISQPAPQKSPSRAYTESNTIERMGIISELGKSAEKDDSAAIKELVKLGQKSDGATGERIYDILREVAIDRPQILISALDELPAKSRSEELTILLSNMEPKSRKLFESTLKKNSGTPTLQYSIQKRKPVSRTI